MGLRGYVGELAYIGAISGNTAAWKQTTVSMMMVNRTLTLHKPYLIIPVGFPSENAEVPNIKKKTFKEICTIL